MLEVPLEFQARLATSKDIVDEIFHPYNRLPHCVHRPEVLHVVEMGKEKLLKASNLEKTEKAGAERKAGAGRKCSNGHLVYPLKTPHAGCRAFIAGRQALKSFPVNSHATTASTRSLVKPSSAAASPPQQCQAKPVAKITESSPTPLRTLHWLLPRFSFSFRSVSFHRRCSNNIIQP